MGRCVGRCPFRRCAGARRLPMRDEKGANSPRFRRNHSRAYVLPTRPRSRHRRELTRPILRSDRGLEPEDRRQPRGTDRARFRLLSLKEVETTPSRGEILEEREPKTVADGVRDLNWNPTRLRIACGALDEEDHEAILEKLAAILERDALEAQPALYYTDNSSWPPDATEAFAVPPTDCRRRSTTCRHSGFAGYVL